MSYQELLTECARLHGIESATELLENHSDKYAFLIKSRERGKRAADYLSSEIGVDLTGLRVLDVGCGYGSFSIEFSNLGAFVVGTDVNDKWLTMARANARGEADIPFIKCDASARQAVTSLAQYAPFDLIIINDVLEHIFDTVGLLHNLRALSKLGTKIYYKVPNGLATRSVLSEGHKKIFGISLLAPDYWPYFTGYPFSIYYRRWEYFKALFRQFGFAASPEIKARDADLTITVRHIRNDLKRIRRHLDAQNFESMKQYLILRDACEYYLDEAVADLDTLTWDELFHKYRSTFWEGVLTYEPLGHQSKDEGREGGEMDFAAGVTRE